MAGPRPAAAALVSPGVLDRAGSPRTPRARPPEQRQSTVRRPPQPHSTPPRLPQRRPLRSQAQRPSLRRPHALRGRWTRRQRGAPPAPRRLRGRSHARRPRHRTVRDGRSRPRLPTWARRAPGGRLRRPHLKRDQPRVGWWRRTRPLRSPPRCARSAGGLATDRLPRRPQGAEAPGGSRAARPAPRPTAAPARLQDPSPASAGALRCGAMRAMMRAIELGHPRPAHGARNSTRPSLQACCISYASSH